MNVELSFLLGPLTGGVIGYFTNWLAIKMMFRPYKAKHILGMQIPFTPGLIPKKKGRIPESIGGAIFQNLTNQGVLEHNILFDEMVLRKNICGGFIC